MSGEKKANDESWAAAHEVSQKLVLQAAIQDVEKKAVKLDEDLTISLKENEKQSEVLKTMQRKIDELEASLRSESTKLRAVQNDFERSSSALESMRLAEKEKEARFDRLQRESDALRDEIGRLNTENTEYRSKLNETEAQVKLENTEILPLRYEVQRLTTEIESHSTHSAWLEQELKTKTDQILALRSEQAQAVKKLQRELDDASDENEKLSRDSAMLRQHLQAAQSRIDESEKDLQEVRKDASEKALEQEQAAAASKRLVSIQKQKIDRLTDKYNSVCRQMERLKQLAKDAQQEGNSDLDARERELQNQMDGMLREQAREFSKQLADAHEKLELANRRCEQVEDSLLLDDASSPSKRRQHGDRSTMEKLSLTDLYSRISTAEDRFQKETLLRKQAEIRVARIEADIRAKAPELLRQRKEYEVAVERQFEYKNRLQGALEEAEEARSRYSELEVEVQELQSRNKDLELDSIELAKQVQSLLTSRSGDDGGVESIPAPITEMQSTNQRLLSEHRQLTAKVKELEGQLQENSWQEKCERLEEEMQALISDRKRQEVLVEQIVEQRDLFRALVKNQDHSASGDTSLAVLNKHGERTKKLEESKKKSEEKLLVAEKMLDAANQNSLQISERLSRYESLNADLTKAVDKLQSQLSAAMANTAKLSADSEFHKKKSSRADSVCLRLREELSEMNGLRNKLQLANNSLEDALSKTNSECGKIESELEQTKAKLRVAESQIESSRKAKERASSEVKQLRMELARQDSLSNSIQRIEATLSAKNVATEESYKTEVKELSKKLADQAEDHASEVRRLEEELHDRDIRLKMAEETNEKTAREALQAEKKILEANALNKQLQERNASLESDLSMTKEKLSPLDKTIPASDLNMRIESLTEKFNSAKKENENLRMQVAALKEVSKGSEDAVAEMTNALKIAKSSRTDELSALEDQLRVATAELEKMKQVVADLTRDLSNQRAEREKAVQDERSKLIEAESRIARLESDAEGARRQYKELESEAAQVKLEAANAQQNYERELSLHSQARTDLRSARQDAENQRRERCTAETKLQNLNLEISQQKAIVSKENADLESRFREQEKTLEEQRAQNAILHEQLEKIGDQIQGIQGGTISVQESHPLQEEESNHNLEMQKTIFELREVIKFVRSEKEIIRIQLDAARREAERDRAAAEVARRSLDTLRAEIRQKKESPGSVDSNKLKSKLNDAENRCQLLEESNTHLRDEMKACQQKIASLSADLDASNQASIPWETKQRDLEAKKAELESEKDSLRREVDDWKGRVQALITQFNQIDPIEHQKVLKELDILKTELQDISRKKIEAEDESKRIRQLAGRASKELQQNKQLVEKQKKMILDLTEERDNIAKLHKGNKLQDLEELKSRMRQLEDERNNGKKLLLGANEMNEKLRDRLRQFQKVINESKKKEAFLHSELEEARAKAKDSDPETNPQSQPTTATEVPTHKGNNTGDVQHQQQVERSQAKDDAAAVAQPRTAKAAPSLPNGGFTFGPSEASGTALQADRSSDISGRNMVVEVNHSEGNEFLTDEKNKSKETVNRSSGTSKDDDQDSSSQAESTVNASIPRRHSGERKELSIKEKLMERKRKLMMDMQMKQEALRRTQDETQSSKEEPAAKRKKVTAVEIHQSSVPVVQKEAGETKEEFTSDQAPDQSQPTDSAVDKVPTSDVEGSARPATTNRDKKPEETDAHHTNMQKQASTTSLSNDKEATPFGSAFLNIKPPGVSSSAPTFQFGSSNSITLPTPSTPQPSSIFNAFSSTASGFSSTGVGVKPLFPPGKEKNKDAVDPNDEGANKS